MHESDTFLAILEEGEAKNARKNILLVGEKRLGRPEESLKEQLGGIMDLDRLTRMMSRAVDAISWQEILETP